MGFHGGVVEREVTLGSGAPIRGCKPGVCVPRVFYVLRFTFPPVYGGLVV